jgi:hypothetical protein
MRAATAAAFKMGKPQFQIGTKTRKAGSAGNRKSGKAAIPIEVMGPVLKFRNAKS